MKKFYFSIEDNKLVNSRGIFSADEKSTPQSTLGQKDYINIQFVKNTSIPLANYEAFKSGTVARFLVDVDYQNAGIPIPLGAGGWSLSVGAEYKKILSSKPDNVTLNNIDATEGVAGSLNAGEWAYNETTNEIIVRLIDDTDPSTKSDDYVEVLYLNPNATPLFIEASSDVFNLANSWLEDDGITLRTPDITQGEVSFYINSNTVNFYNRLGGSQKQDGFAEVQFFDPDTNLFFMKAKFNYTCTNRLLSSGEDELEITGVDVYTKAESDTRYVRQTLATVYPELNSLVGTERFFLRDGSVSKQTTLNTIESFVSIDVGNVAYVSKNGNDATAVVGKVAKSFSTIMGAANACHALSPSNLNRFVVIIAPGYYAEYINLDGKPHIDLKAQSFGTVYITGAGGVGPCLNLTNGGAESYFDMEDIFFLFTPSADGQNCIHTDFTQVDFKKCPVIVTDSNNYSFNVFDATSGLVPVIECTVFVTITGTGTPAGEINVMNIENDAVFVNGLQLINVTSSQLAGNINIIQDSSVQPNSISLTDCTVNMTNVAYSGEVKFIKMLTPATFGKIYITSKCNSFSAGNGSFYGIYSNSGGASIVTIQGTTINCTGFANCYIGYAVGANDTINLDFCSLGDNYATGGSGTVNKVITSNNELRVSTAIVDENLLLPDETPTNYRIEDLFNIIFSSGWVNGFDITDNGDGSVDIASGTAMIRSANDEQAPIYSVDVPAKASIVLTNNQSNYIYIDYNTGNPEIFSTTVSEDIVNNENNKFELWEIFREGTDLHITDHKQRIKNIASLTQQYIYELYTIRYGNGLKIANVGTRNISMDAGDVWVKFNKTLINSLNTSIADTFTAYYNVAGSYTKVIGLTQWDNLNYDNGTDLVLMGVGKYSYKDFYIETDGRLVMLYGENQYNSAIDATNANERAVKPSVLTDHSLYIGRIIFEQNNSTPVDVIDKTEVATTGGGSSISVHNDLSGKQGGTDDEYYHSTASEYVKIQLLVKNKYDATSAPTVNDDATQGYAVGSTWINITSDIMYRCVDSTTGTAIWKQIVDTNSIQTLSNKTLISPVINTSISGSAVLDDDTFATASNTTIATSESIKAYVDSNTAVTVPDLEFTDGDLVSGVLTITGLKTVASIVDNIGDTIAFADKLNYGATNTTIDLSSFGTITGTWKVKFAQGYGTSTGSTFTSLTDTPASYSGQSGKVVTVNSGENALEFVDVSGGGLINTILSMTSESFSFPAVGIVNPFTNAQNTANISFDVDNYGAKSLLLSPAPTSSDTEPIQFVGIPVIPTGVTNFTFKIIYEPETLNAWDGSTIVWKGQAKKTTDNTSWSAVTTFTIGTDTSPTSGSNPLVFEATVSLATMGLAVGDTFQMVIYVDSTSTWAHDIAFQSCEIEVS